MIVGRNSPNDTFCFFLIRLVSFLVRYYSFCFLFFSFSPSSFLSLFHFAFFRGVHGNDAEEGIRVTALSISSRDPQHCFVKAKTTTQFSRLFVLLFAGLVTFASIVLGGVRFQGGRRTSSTARFGCSAFPCVYVLQFRLIYFLFASLSSSEYLIPIRILLPHRNSPSQGTLDTGAAWRHCTSPLSPISICRWKPAVSSVQAKAYKQRRRISRVRSFISVILHPSARAGCSR